MRLHFLHPSNFFLVFNHLNFYLNNLVPLEYCCSYVFEFKDPFFRGLMSASRKEKKKNSQISVALTMQFVFRKLITCATFLLFFVFWIF